MWGGTADREIFGTQKKRRLQGGRPLPPRAAPLKGGNFRYIPEEDGHSQCQSRALRSARTRAPGRSNGGSSQRAARCSRSLEARLPDHSRGDVGQRVACSQCTEMEMRMLHTEAPRHSTGCSEPYSTPMYYNMHSRSRAPPPSSLQAAATSGGTPHRAPGGDGLPLQSHSPAEQPRHATPRPAPSRPSAPRQRAVPPGGPSTPPLQLPRPHTSPRRTAPHARRAERATDDTTQARRKCRPGLARPRPSLAMVSISGPRQWQKLLLLPPSRLLLPTPSPTSAPHLPSFTCSPPCTACGLRAAGRCGASTRSRA